MKVLIPLKKPSLPMLNEHFHCKSDEPVATASPSAESASPPWQTEPAAAPVVAPVAVAETSVEDDIDELLADL